MSIHDRILSVILAHKLSNAPTSRNHRLCCCGEEVHTMIPHLGHEQHVAARIVAELFPDIERGLHFEELPVGTVVVDADGDVFHRLELYWWMAGSEHAINPRVMISTPAHVIWQPGV